MNVLGDFRFDVLGLEIEEDSFAELESRIGDLEPWFDFVVKEETNAKSGQRVGIYFGYQASYVAVTPRVPGAHKDYTIGLQSTRTGLLDQVRAVFDRIGVRYGYVTDAIYGPNGESMDWYDSIEPAPDGIEIPVFLNEYTHDYLEDIGLSERERDQIGRSKEDGNRVLFTEVAMELSVQGQAVVRSLSGSSAEPNVTEVVRRRIRDNSELVIVPAQESVLREFRLPTRIPGDLDLGMFDSWRFTIVDGVFVGRRAA